MILLGLVGLAAPAATAGAICLDKARGNLTLLFATDLSDAEIVLGKLAARLVPVLGMILCAAPVLALATLFGGVDPVVARSGPCSWCLACAVFGCSLALTLSVWGRKTHEVLMATYVFGILYLLAAPICAGLQAMLPRGVAGAVAARVLGPAAVQPDLPGAGAARRVARRCPVTIGTYATFLGTGPGGLGGAGRCGDVADPGGGHPAARPGRAGARRRTWAAWLLGRVDLDRLGRWGPATVRLGLLVAGRGRGRRWTATRCSGASAGGGGRRAGASRSGGPMSCSAAVSASRRSPAMIGGRPLGPRAWRGGQRPAGVGRAAAAQRLGRDEPGRGAPAGQPRRADGHAAADPVDRLGQVVGRLPRRATAAGVAGAAHHRPVDPHRVRSGAWP